MKKEVLTYLIVGAVTVSLGIASILTGAIRLNDSGDPVILYTSWDSLMTGPAPTTVTIAAVGDVMMGTDYPSSRIPPQDGALLFDEPSSILQQADIAFGNLEGPITTSTGCTKNTSSGKSYAFRCPPRLAGNLKQAGFDVMGLANNHSMDFGYAGMAQTKRILDSLGIQYSSKNGEVGMFTIKGITIGVIAFATGPAPRSILNIQACREEVGELADSFDILVVSFHGGTEGTRALHTKDVFENLYGEPRGNVVQFAHAMIDAGADLIIGHGPHVPRALQMYKGKLVAYSLGNFCTYRCMNLTAQLGYAPLLVAKLDTEGNLIKGGIHSFRQIPPGGPSLDTTKAAFNLIRELSLADFPESAPSFCEDTWFYPDDACLSGDTSAVKPGETYYSR